MANKLPENAAKLVESIQAAMKAQERLELEGLVAQTGMLRARRNTLARAAKQRPERAARYESHLAAVSASIKQADERVLERAFEIKSRPASSKGLALRGRILDDRGVPLPSKTVAALSPKEEVVAWTTSGIGGWYALTVEDAKGAALVQVSDERGTVISKEQLEGIAPGARLRRDFNLPEAKTKGTAPPQSKGGPTQVKEPASVVRRAELMKVRDAKTEAVETHKAAVESLDAREAELKVSQDEVSARVKKVRGQVSRTRTELRKIDAEMDGHESKESAEYDALAKRRETHVAKLQTLERELEEAEAQEAGLAKALADLSAEREAAEAALAKAQAELAAAEAELAALATGKR